MGDNKGEEVLTLSNQYGLAGELFRTVYAFTGTLTRQEIIETIDVLRESFADDLDDDFGRVDKDVWLSEFRKHTEERS